MKKIVVVLLTLIGVSSYSQTLSEVQMQNARATGYAIIAARNPSIDFSVMVIPWDGTHTLEYNAQNQINPSWHPQCVVKGNYFEQTFDGSNFSGYSSVLTSEAQFNLYKNTGTQWWIVCSTIPSFSNTSGIASSVYNTDGFLTGSRTISMAGNNLSINPTSGSHFFINGINGNVGIGTNAPIAKLDVLGNIVAGTNSATDGVNAFSVRYGANGTLNYWGSLYSSAATFMSYGVKAAVGSIGWASSDPQAIAKSSVSLDNDGIHFYTAPTQSVANNTPITMNEVVKISNSGNLGIGTNAPTTKLHVNTGVEGDSGLRLNNLTSSSSTTAGNNKALSVDASGNVILVPVTNTGGTSSNIYTADGTLSANRTVNLAGNNLTFNPSAANSQFTVNGTTGSINAVRGIFTSNQPNGQTYASGGITNDSCVAFSAGSVIGSGPGYNNTRMLNFFDFPAPSAGSNTGATAFFNIVDRNDMDRFRMIATAGISSTFLMYNKSQQEVLKVNEDGSDNVYMHFPKANSRVIIGGLENNPNAAGHKLFVQSGSAKVEGNILTDSNVGIGTSTFIDSNDNKAYRLSVKGRVRAEEVKVYNTWADYVFANEYKLRPLSEVESFITKNKHLPNVPSAKEVTEKGLELGEMAKIQQEKIEELTLYLIQQNKQIEELKMQVKLLMEKK